MINNPYLNLKGYLKDTLFKNSHGSSTMEYVIVIAAVGLLGTILYTTMNDEGGSWIETTVPKIFQGEELSVGQPSRNNDKQDKLDGAISYNNSENDRSRPYNNISDVDLTDKELLAAAKLSYSYDGMNDLGKYQNMLGKDWKEDRKLFVDKNGFQGRVFVNEKTDQVIIAYRGTDEASDYLTDAQLITGAAVNQYDEATDFYKRALKRYPNHRKVQVGHSLGGNIAQRMALDNKIPAFTFNAPGLKYRYIGGGVNPNFSAEEDLANANGKYDDLIINYIDENDEIGNVGVHAGRTYVFGERGVKETDDSSAGEVASDIPVVKMVKTVTDIVKGTPNHGVENFEEHLSSGNFDIKR